MKLYDSIGPNPHIVRMFMAEKGIELAKQPVDLRKGENREAEHLKRNPHGQMPTLELDDGSYLSEITAICEYLEEKNPAPALSLRAPRAAQFWNTSGGVLLRLVRIPELCELPITVLVLAWL